MPQAQYTNYQKVDSSTLPDVSKEPVLEQSEVLTNGQRKRRRPETRDHSKSKVMTSSQMYTPKRAKTSLAKISTRTVMRVCGNSSNLFYRYLLPLLVGSTIQPLCLQLGEGRVNLGKGQLHFYISAWPSLPGVYNKVFDGRGERMSCQSSF